MIFSFGTKKKKYKTIAIFDVGSGSVGGAIAQIPENVEEVPVILKSIRHEIKNRKNDSFKSFLKETIITLHHTANALYNKKIGKIDEIVCVLTSPWSSSETKKISISNSKSFVFTKKMADELIKKETANIVLAYENKEDNNGNKESLVEKIITEVFLDDKLTQNPIGKRCKFLDLNMTYSISPQIFLDHAHIVLSHIFHATPVSFSSFAFMSHLMIRENYVGTESHLLLDIGGEVTDLSVINRGVFQSKISFPFGKKTIIKHLGLKLNIDRRDAEELFKLYYKDNLSLEHKSKLAPIFNSIERFWSEELRHCLTNIPKKYALPDIVFLTIDNDMKNWFFEVFRKEEFSQNITLKDKFKIVILDENELVNMCSFKEGVYDPFLMIEATALTKKRTNA